MGRSSLAYFRAQCSDRRTWSTATASTPSLGRGEGLPEPIQAFLPPIVGKGQDPAPLEIRDHREVAVPPVARLPVVADRFLLTLGLPEGPRVKGHPGWRPP